MFKVLNLIFVVIVALENLKLVKFLFLNDCADESATVKIALILLDQ